MIVERPRVVSAYLHASAAGAAMLLPACLAFLVLVGLVLVGPVFPAFAQQAVGESVEGRPRPEYNPLGIRLDDVMRLFGWAEIGPNARPTRDSADTLGSFLLKPVMELSSIYDDNIFRTETEEVSDVIWTFKPGFTIASDWANHALNFSMGADFGRYTEHDSEDYNDFNARLSGKVDIDDGETLDLSASWARGHDERGSLDDVGAPEPTISHATGFSGTYNRDQGELFLRTTAAATFTNYQDNLDVNNDDRDRWIYTLRQRVGHDVDEGSQVFIEGAANLRDYEDRFDDSGTELGSHGYEALVGVTWDASGVTFAEIAVGYFYQTFNESSFADSKGPSFRGRVVWNATGLVTVTANAGREVKETAQAGASGNLSSTFGLRVDWEAFYNLILTAQSGYVIDDVGNGDREDETTNIALRARWLIDQHWSLRGALEHAVRDSTEAGENYTNTKFTISLVEQL